MKKIKLLDTFAGIGGFHLALEQAMGKENVECIGFSEIDKFAKQVYKEHFPQAKDLGDISKIDIDSLPDFDLLTGGFPCQDVSVAGKQSLDGGRTILVEYLLQILETKQPSYFVFENVKGLMSKKFDTFRKGIFKRIGEAGYTYTYKILNTKDFGLPQNRERVFIVGSKNIVDKSVFNGEQKLTTFLKDILEKEVDEKYLVSEKHTKAMINARSSGKLNLPDMNSICGTIIASYYKISQDGPYINNIIQLNNPTHSNNRIYGINGISPTLNTMQGGNRQPFILENRIRKLTPTECCRLQGFPDNWNEIVSNTQRYKQMGNAISIPVIRAIFNNLFKNNANKK